MSYFSFQFMNSLKFDCYQNDNNSIEDVTLYNMLHIAIKLTI